MKPDTTTNRYQGQQGRQYHEGKRGIPENAYPWVANLRAEKLAPHIADGSTVLEYGVGSGWNLAAVKARRRLGYDISDFLAPAVEGRGIEFISTLNSIPKGSMDVVLCHHALEHLLEPSVALQQMLELLKPGGKLLLFVPFEKERKYRKFHRDEPNHHLYSWNVQTLGNLVEDVGFHVLEAAIAEFGYDRFAASLTSRIKAGENGFRFIRKLLHMFRPLKEVRVIAVRPA